MARRNPAATNALLDWLTTWHAQGGAARLSEPDRERVIGWLSQGADANASLRHPDKRETPFLVAALVSPELSTLLIEHGAQATDALVVAIADRCTGWTQTPITASQRMARLEEQRLWRNFVGGLVYLWPGLDWYQMRAAKPDKDGTRTIVPSAKVIETHIPGFTCAVETARVQAGLPMGPTWTRQSDKDEALLDLLCSSPELHSLSGRDRYAQLRQTLSDGADIQVQAGQSGQGYEEVLMRAMALGDGRVMSILVEAGVQSSPVFEGWLAAWMNGERDPAGSQRRPTKEATAACLRVLLECEGLVDWGLYVRTQRGSATLGHWVDTFQDGLYSQAMSDRLEAKTAPASSTRGQTARL